MPEKKLSLNELVGAIIDSMNQFRADAHKLENKAAARRARKESLYLTKLLKQYRADSPK